MTDALPIDDAIPALLAALGARGRAVLQAPPGAGKSTRVPLAILSAGLTPGRIVMLEPRRLAARAAAERMAQTLGEPVGQTVGYRMRGEVKVSPTTRIEVVTEGVFTRIIQSDPDLPGIGAVILDEFHERSIDTDLALALTLDARGALRPDLLLLVMSATLDAAPVAALMEDAPLITSAGTSFAVTSHWLDRPMAPGARLELACADLILTALARTAGGLLAFLPGEGEIRRVFSTLQGKVQPDVHLRMLYGAMPFADQRAALAPVAQGRKVVLATSIAETALTIPDIRVVVDAGRARRARFDPGSGMSRLVTERVTRAEAIQRAGRAGRVAPGDCYKLWTKGEEGAFAAFPPPEIAVGDLTPLALNLAIWGPGALRFLTPPPTPALAKARALLADLGALDGVQDGVQDGKIDGAMNGAIDGTMNGAVDGAMNGAMNGARVTPHGQAMAALPLHPRLAHMALVAGAQAAGLAALLSDRDPFRGMGTDIAPRLAALTGRDGPGHDFGRNPVTDPGALARLRAETARLARRLPAQPPLSVGAMAALAFPDRIGKRRKGGEARYVLSGGKGAVMPPQDALAGQDLIVALDTNGDPREATVRLAAPLTEAELRAVFADRIVATGQCHWSARDGRVIARQVETLGALTLTERPWPDAPADALARAMLDGVRALGLTLPPAAERFCTRVELVRAGAADLPDMSLPGLLEGLEDWLLAWLGGLRSTADWQRFDPLPALAARLTSAQRAALDRAAPAQFQTPLGRAVPIDYAGGTPAITVRLQEMFGTTRHPTIGATALKITLLSPGQHPVAITTDLPGFWRHGYGDARRDMRGRYPRHPWPDDPAAAPPTLRAKPRGT